MPSREVTVGRVLQPDRRVHRAPTPTCSYCGKADKVSAIRRTTHAVAFRCTDCGRVRVMPIESRLQCPECGSESVRPSRTRWWQRPRRWLAGQRPIYCHICDWRGWV